VPSRAIFYRLVCAGCLLFSRRAVLVTLSCILLFHLPGAVGSSCRWRRKAGVLLEIHQWWLAVVDGDLRPALTTPPPAPTCHHTTGFFTLHPSGLYDDKRLSASLSRGIHRGGRSWTDKSEPAARRPACLHHCGGRTLRFWKRWRRAHLQPDAEHTHRAFALPSVRDTGAVGGAGVCGWTLSTTALTCWRSLLSLHTALLVNLTHPGGCGGIKCVAGASPGGAGRAFCPSPPVILPHYLKRSCTYSTVFWR